MGTKAEKYHIWSSVNMSCSDLLSGPLHTRVHDFNVKLICAELVKKWQFETTVQIECQKWYWQGHVKNTVTYVIKFVDAINPICILSLCGPYNHNWGLMIMWATQT
jgi:hypothetical protein